MPIATTSSAALAHTATIAKIVTSAAHTAATGPLGVRFCTVSSKPGMGIEHTAKQTAAAMGMGVLDLRMPHIMPGDFEDGADLHVHYRKMLENMGDAFIVCSECGDDRGPSPVMREVIRFLAAQDVDRDDVPRARVIMLTTHGPVAGLSTLVFETTGHGVASSFVVQD